MAIRPGDDTAQRAEALTQRLSSEPEDRDALRELFELYEQRAAHEASTEGKLAAWRELASHCERVGQVEGAVTALERARALAPSDVKLTHALASALVQRSARGDETKRALDLDRVADLLCDVAGALTPREARKFLIAALGHAPWHARALYELEGLTPEAERGSLAGYWVAYLAQNPDGDLANERRVSLARAYVAAGQNEDAIFALEPAAQAGFAEATAMLSVLRPNAPAVPPPLPRPSEETDAARTRPRAARDGLDDALPLRAASPVEPTAVEEPSAPQEEAPPPAAASADIQQPMAAATAARGDSTQPGASAGAATLRLELKAALGGADPAHTLQLARDLLRLEPADELAFDCLDREYRKSRDHRQRAELLLISAEPDVLPESTRKQRLREAIALFEQKLSDPEGALRAYRALLGLEPGSEDALRGMARMLERNARWDELCECLERMAAASRDGVARAALLRRIVDLQRRERKDRAAAADALARLVELDPNDRAARIALGEELSALERWDDLARLLERRAEEPASKAERVGILRQLASLFEGPLEDRQAAFEAYQRIVELAPDDSQALTRMEEIDEQAGDHERLLRTFTRRLDRASPTQATQLLVRMATIAEADLLDQDRAHAYLRKALDLAPHNAQVAASLANLCERAGRFDELLGLLRERARTEKQAKARAEVLRRMATLLADQLQDADAAASVWRSVNEIQDDLEAWTFLEGYARQRNDDASLSEALRKLAELETDPARVRQHLLERADLLTQLGHPQEAVEPVSRVLLEIDAHDADARRKLESLCELLSDYRGLTRVLEDLLGREGDLAQLTALARELADLYADRALDEKRELRALLAWTESDADDPEPWRRLARSYERRKRHKELLEALDALARLEPAPAARAAVLLSAAELCSQRLKDDAGTLARIAQYARLTEGALPDQVLDLARKAGGVPELCALCEATGRYEQLCELLRERIAQSVDPERKAELYRQLATALIEHLQDEPAALGAYEGLLALVDDVDALRFVQAWASRHDDPRRLADALGRLARNESDATERRDLWLERGRILRTQLDDPRAALEAFEEALAVSPDFAPALDELLVASELAGDNARLARALEHKLTLGTAQPRSALAQLADLYEGPLDDAARAVSALARWASVAPDDPAPLRRLRAQYARQERHAELLEVLDALARCEPERAGKLEATVSAAELAFAQLADADGAFARLAPLVPDHDAAADRALIHVAERAGRLPELYELLAKAERYADLAYHLERAARRATEPAERASFLRRAAGVLHAHLNDVERTSAAYAELLTLEEDAPALRYMQARALETSDTRALAEVLLRLSRLESDPRELRDLLYDYAHLQSFRLHAPQLAVPVLRRILEELDPSFEPALDELLTAADAARDTDALVFALTRCVERESDAARKCELCERLADVYERELHDDARSAQSLQLWASLSPEDPAPLRRLRRCFERTGQWAELAACYDRIAEHSPDAEEQREASLAAARLYLGPLRDPDVAFTRLSALMQQGVVQAEDALHKLAFEHGRLEELCGLYEQAGRYDELCELLRRRAEAEPDPERKAGLLVRAARLLTAQLADEFAASEAYRQVLTIREDVEALSYLRAVAERQDDVEALDQLLLRLARGSEPLARVPLELARARLLRDRLGAPSEACKLLCSLLRDSAQLPVDPLLRDQIIRELEATAEQTEARDALALALEARLDTLRDAVKRRAVALHLADLCEAELGDPDRAAAALRVACAADPRHVIARRRLKAHLARQGAHKEYVNLLDTLAHLEPNPVDRREARLSAARCAHEQLHDGAGALTRLSPLLNAGDAEAEQLARSIAREAGLGRELATLYIARARQAASPLEAESSWRAVMEIHEQWLSDPAEAFEAALRLLAGEPHNREHLDQVDRLATELKAWKRLSSVYAKLIRAAGSDAVRVSLNQRLSRLLEQNAEGQAALEYAVAAARGAPSDENLQRVEQLAVAQASASEQFWAQEQRAASASDPHVAITRWLEAARTADLALRDREQANTCLRRALLLTEQAPELAPAVLALSAELDAARPELGAEDARRALLRAHLELAEQASPSFRTQLVLRAAQFASEALQDARAGFDVLRGGAAVPPFPEPLLDALEQAAVRINRLDALDAQLARSAERSDAIHDKQRLLTRRARVLTERLSRYDQAAQVYERLLELAPHDADAARSQLECLRKAGRHRELLRACERRLSQVDDSQSKLALMREMAQIWEVELKNRASALAIWNDVHALAPRDEEATRAVARLREVG